MIRVSTKHICRMRGRHGSVSWTAAGFHPRLYTRIRDENPIDIWENEVRSGDTVYVGMSGGVDSSVTAHLLKSRNLNVEAVFMRNWDTRDERGECPSERDWQDVQKVCRKLDIKCHEVNLVKEYWNSVFSIALDDYAKGRTPNPDLLCNKEIKFGVLLNEIQRRLGPRDWFATGHYARSMRIGGEAALFRGVDRRKDQSYYLAAVSSGALDRVIFPLGSLIKTDDVRRIARDTGLHNADKEESMGICFVGERRRFDQFLAEYLSQTPGDIISHDGRNLGRHQGLFSRTIGQTAGISGWQDKWYIYAKEPATNRMYAVQNRNHPLLYSHEITASPVHWIAKTPPKGLDAGQTMNLDAQIRHMQQPQGCTIRCQVSTAATVDASSSASLIAKFDNAQFGVAPGQYLVVYDGDRCLGSAVIS